MYQKARSARVWFGVWLECARAQRGWLPKTGTSRASHRVLVFAQALMAQRVKEMQERFKGFSERQREQKILDIRDVASDLSDLEANIALESCNGNEVLTKVFFVCHARVLTWRASSRVAPVVSLPAQQLAYGGSCVYVCGSWKRLSGLRIPGSKRLCRTWLPRRHVVCEVEGHPAACFAPPPCPGRALCWHPGRRAGCVYCSQICGGFVSPARAGAEVQAGQ